MISLWSIMGRGVPDAKTMVSIRVAVGEGMGNLALLHTLTQNLITHSIPSSNLSTSSYPYSLDNG